jgi:hypothetical protein
MVGALWKTALRQYTHDRGLTGGVEIDAKDEQMIAHICERAFCRDPRIRARRRLARFYIRRSRRELIEQQRYIEAAARLVLMGAASTGVTG